MAQVQELWGKLNAQERQVATGALVILGAWLVGILTGTGFGIGSLPLVGALAVLAIYYLKYAPNQQSINWPAPIPTLVLVISAVVGLFALLALVSALSWLGLAAGLFGGFLLGAFVATLAVAAGGALMAWGAWQEYQAQKTTV